MWRVRILIAIGLALAVLQAGATFAGGSPFVAASIAPDLPRAATVKPAPGMFLVSKRALGGTYFGETVIYLVEHDEQGTLGLIVNRSSNIRLADALPDIEQRLAARHRLYSGGPVEPAMIMMLLRGESATQGMAHVAGPVYVSADRRVLDAALEAGKRADEFRLYIGYSGWSAGQLDAEIERGSWYVVPAAADAVFSAESDSLWQWLIERLEPSGIEVRDERRLNPGAAA